MPPRPPPAFKATAAAGRPKPASSAIPSLKPLPLNPRLYEINARIWLKEHDWTLTDVPDAVLDDWAAHFDIIWLMGVWRPSVRGREVARAHPGVMSDIRQALPNFAEKDVVASPYAIADYQVSPLLGGNTALADLRDRLHRRGLRLILDLVPNHMAVDHPWVSAHPERFIQGKPADIARAPQNYFRAKSVRGEKIFAHGKDPYFDGWQDTIQINIFDAGMRYAMIELLMDLSEVCDGVRCDMAMLLLNAVFKKTWSRHVSSTPDAEFWQEAVSTVKMHRPDFLFLAEVYWDMEYRLQQLGFDFTYDKKLLDLLRVDSADRIRAHLRADLGFQSRSARMIENHDEKRASAVFEGARHRAAALLSYGVPGLRFFHEGQFEGRRVKVPVQLGRRQDEPVDPDDSMFYHRLLDELPEDVMLNGQWQMLESLEAWEGNPSHAAMFGFWWQLGDDVRLVVVNDSPNQSQTYLRLPVPKRYSGLVRFKDHLSDRAYDRDAAEVREFGMYFDMPAFDVHLFRIDRVS